MVGFRGETAEGARVVVLMDLPPGLDKKQARSSESIKRACKRAVYDLGLEEFGWGKTGNKEEDEKNKKRLVVVTIGEEFDIPFVPTKITKLLRPEEVEKVKASGGKVEVGVRIEAPNVGELGDEETTPETTEE